MFDPFNDINEAGYLRNKNKEKDLELVKKQEHFVFKANIDKAFGYLTSTKNIQYQNFLKAHEILFSNYYPWAGKDRATLLPDSSVNKGNVLFAHPMSAQLAVEAGLRLGSDKQSMNKKPGEVMGLFAYGHPFLDGNGRTMILVHAELCRRAGYAIAWQDTDKNDYLTKLTKEIENPGKGILDSYLLGFKENLTTRISVNNIASLKGLDGLNSKAEGTTKSIDTETIAIYKEAESKRHYTTSNSALNISSALTEKGIGITKEQSVKLLAVAEKIKTNSVIEVQATYKSANVALQLSPAVIKTLAQGNVDHSILKEQNFSGSDNDRALRLTEPSSGQPRPLNERTKNAPKHFDRER